jgi:hypothetical protein
MGHVVAVTDERDGRALQGPGLGEGLQVGERLAGMLQVGQQVDDRCVGVGRQGLEVAVAEHPEGEHVEVAVEHPPHVLHRLALAEADLVVLEHQRLGAEQAARHLARHPGAQRRLLEEQPDRPVLQRPTDRLGVLLEPRRRLQHRGEAVVAQVGHLQEISHRSS